MVALILTLRFHGDRQWVQYGEGGPRVSFQANRTSEGTWPRGSQWTRNPIPACAGPWGGYNEAEAHCFQEDGATQFPPPAPGAVTDFGQNKDETVVPGLYGFGSSMAVPGFPTFLFSVMDEVEIPEDLSPGDYVLSFRWDCEQTPQIWNACANVEITCENCVK